MDKTINLPFVALLFCEQFLPGGSIDRLRGLVSVGLGMRIVRRDRREPCSESVRNPSDSHTQTPQKPERADDSRTQTHRNKTARLVDRSGYCSQNMSRTQGKFIVLSIYLLDTYARCRSSLCLGR